MGCYKTGTWKRRRQFKADERSQNLRSFRAFFHSQKHSKAASIQRSLASYGEGNVEQRVEVSLEEIAVLSKRLKAEPGYYAPRLEVEHLERAIRERRAVFYFYGGHIEAFAALWPTNRTDWLELGTVWVGKSLRGKGLRNALMTETVALVPKGASLFLFSSVEKIQESADGLGFEPMTTEVFPGLLGWASEVGIVCRLPGSIHPVRNCGEYHEWGTPKPGERRFFIRLAKAHAE